MRWGFSFSLTALTTRRTTIARSSRALASLLACGGVAVLIAACEVRITMPGRAPTYWCYSDSLRAARDSFPLCPPDSATVNRAR